MPALPITVGTEMVACHECDALHRVPELAPGATAHCHVCGAVMARNPKGGLDRTIALYITALILLLLEDDKPTREIMARTLGKDDWQDIPVIVLTARDLTDEDRRMLNGRVEQIVEKGACAHEQVVNLVRQAVERTST